MNKINLVLKNLGDLYDFNREIKKFRFKKKGKKRTSKPVDNNRILYPSQSNNSD